MTTYLECLKQRRRAFFFGFMSAWIIVSVLYALYFAFDA